MPSPDMPADPEPTNAERPAPGQQLLLPAFDALPDAVAEEDDAYAVPPLSMLTPASWAAGW